MNDLPAVVAWLIAGALGLVLAPILWLLRARGVPVVRHWLLLGVGWLVSAAVVGPFIFAVGAVLLPVALNTLPPSETFSSLLLAVVYTGVMASIMAVLFFALPYLPVLLLWVRLGHRLGWLEFTQRGVVVSSLLLAMPGALTGMVAYGVMDEPFGYKGWALVRFGGVIHAAIALSLLVPRLVFPPLRAGRFAPHANSTASSA